MEGLSFEEQPASQYPIDKKKSAELPLLTKKQIQKLREYLGEMKKNNISNPHWEYIEPDTLEPEDIYAYKKIILDKSDEWFLAKNGDPVRGNFGRYEEIVNAYLKEKYNMDYKLVIKDSRSNMKAYLRSYLSGKSKTIH